MHHSTLFKDTRLFPHISHLSLLHTCTHMGHCEGHPAFPTFPLVPGISEDLPDPLFADPSNTYGPTFTTGWCFLQKGYHHVDGPCFSLPSSFIWISCTQTEDTVAITIVLYNRTRFWSCLLTYLWKSTMKSQMFVHFYTELSWWKEKSVKHILKSTISAGWCSNTSVFISNLKICLMTFHSYCFN